MNRSWNELAARVNAMTLRERFLLFAALMTILAAITNEVFVAPLAKLQRQHAAQIEKSSAAIEIQRSRMEHDLAQRRRGRVAELEAEIARVNDETQALEREIASLSAGASDLAALRATLTRVVRGFDKVALLRIATAEPATAPAPGVSATPFGLDITLGGGYLDLMDCLAAFESALPQARWGSIRFTAETTPPQLTVRIVAPRVGP